MRLIDMIEVQSGGVTRRIELLQGDLTAIPAEHAVDVLVVSAFPNDYVPTSTSLVGALLGKGVSVYDLAQNKAVDLRRAFSCWLSEEITPIDPGIRFNRVLCFEPLVRGKPPEVVGDIFRALAPFLGGPESVSTVAMPIVAAGDQGYEISEMLPPLLDAATHWMAVGLPLENLKIVAYSDQAASEAQPMFAEQKLQFAGTQSDTQKYDYDVFVSYAHEDTVAAGKITRQLRQGRLRTFVDTHSIDKGAAWQQKIFSALDSCVRMVAVYSPSYIKSKVCQEEFNIAWARARKLSENVIFPIYWASAQLPTYMDMLNYEDCREESDQKLDVACRRLVTSIR
jgi:hypothetical protein